MARRTPTARPATLGVEVGAASEPERQPALSWPVAAVAGSAAVAAAGWVLCAAPAAIAWLTTSEASLPSALLTATRAWLLAHGAPATFGGVEISITPLGFTALLFLLATGVAGYATQQALLADVEDAPPRDEAASGGGWSSRVPSAVVRVVGAVTATYVVVVGVVAFSVEQPTSALRALVGALLVGGLSAVLGACRAAGWNPFDLLPGWLRAVPRAAAAAMLVVLASASALLTAALLLRKDNVVTLHEALQPGLGGSVMLFLLELAYVPNLIAWSASWVLGAGVSIGAGSVIVPGHTSVGLLPAFPVLGIVPDPGVGSMHALWWLATGVVAGVVAAWIIVSARPRARFDETALVGGLAGVAAGLLVTLVCAMSGGALGVERLATIGARTPQLVVLAPTLMGLSGIVTGLVLGLVRGWERPADAGGALEGDDLSQPADDDTHEMHFR